MPDPDDAAEQLPRRTDARRNRAKILAAAKAAFAAPEADASMAEIARRAGIGSATLYRNFPDRRALLEALYSEEITLICLAAETGVGDAAGGRLEAWLRRFYDYVASKGVLASELLEHTDEEAPVFGSGYARIVTAAAPLFEAAQAAGELRSDLDLGQILALIAAVAHIPGDPAYRRPLLNAALDGLRSRD